MEVRIIDLFAGIGGIRLGLEQALRKAGHKPRCVFTSEIKPHAIRILKQNHKRDKITGDITKVVAKDIPDFDILCGGFPCQAFSPAGNRDGFADTRGTLFFDVERIIRAKKPMGFLLENVEGLEDHDHGRTLKVIVGNLDKAGYRVSYRVLNSMNFGVPQDRSRIYIVGVRKSLGGTAPDLTGFRAKKKKLGKVLESGMPTSDTPFVRTLLEHFTVEELAGKAIKDKRGGESNIPSWDLETKGPVSQEQRSLLNAIMLERRKKHWAEEIGIKWMDGMPLTKDQIETFYKNDNLQAMLDDLVRKGYMRFEHPKEQVVERHKDPTGDDITTTRRVYAMDKPEGYNIVAGKLSFEVGKVMSPDEIAPTLVATDMCKLYVPDGEGIRQLTLREGLRLFGYPESFKFDIEQGDGYDLLGNTVVVPVIKAVAGRLIDKLNLNDK